MHPDGYPAVDFGARNLFQNRRTLIRARLEKSREFPLGQEHRAGETLEIHPRYLLDPFCDPPDIRFENLPRIRLGEFVPPALQFPPGLPPGPVLGPVTAPASPRGFETHLGEAFTGVPGHDVIPAFGDLPQPGRLSVKGQA